MTLLADAGLKLGWRVRQRQAAASRAPASGGFALDAAAFVK
jgi:hypothetical protein